MGDVWITGDVPSMQKRLLTDKDKRQHVLVCIVLIHNFRTEVVGHNQISAVFAPEYKRVIDINGYDRIRRCYLEPGDYETEDEAELLEENFGDERENEDVF
jgi:hypothetical protein